MRFNVHFKSCKSIVLRAVKRDQEDRCVWGTANCQVFGECCLVEKAEPAFFAFVAEFRFFND